MSNRRCATANAPGGSFGDVMDELKEEGHLTLRQWNAGQLLLVVLQTSHGSSAGIVGQVGDKVDNSTRQPLYPPGGGTGADAVGALLKGLRHHERELFKFLVVHRELPRGSLADWARTRSAYKTNKTCRAMAVGRITGFLDSIAEIGLPAAS